MSDLDTRAHPRGGRLHMRRSRGAVSGFLLLLLGVWGALIPFVGPYFNFAFTPDSPWTWTTGRGWLEVLPGAVVAVGGLLLLMSRNRATAMFGGWLAVIGGAWFVVGRGFAGLLGLGSAGTPVATSETQRLWLELSYFYGLGAVIVFLGAMALGRISVRSVRDVEFAQEYVQRPVTAPSTTTPVAAAPAAQPVVTDQPRADEPVTTHRVTDEPTTVMDQPTGTDRAATAATDRSASTTRRRRPWSNLFSGRRHTAAH